MKAKFFSIMIISLLIAGCSIVINKVYPTSPPQAQPTQMGLPNPASVFCEQQGNKVEIRTDADNNQVGFCIFPDGSECDEWAYYRGECEPGEPGKPGGAGGMLPNPASVHCVEQGYKSEIRTAADGSQSGVCIFTDGAECDEWAYYRGECGPAEYDELGWKIYTNPQFGYSFHYPAEAEIEVSDEPKKSLMIYGQGMGSGYWGVSHPTDMSEYRPPKDADLVQWLTDHYLVGETRLADVQIAGTTAIHFRHEASQQSMADDRYYFAKDGQLYMILIGHGSETEDWELNNRFLQSFQFDVPIQDQPAVIPTPLPIDPSISQDWMTYTNSSYGFTLRLPDTWIVEEDVSGNDPLLKGHEIILHSIDDSHKESIRITIRQAGEDTLLWPTGVGAGEFIPQGTLSIAGEQAQRVLLVCNTGEVTAIWYHQSENQSNLVRGNLEFGIIYSANGHCEPGYSLVGETQRIGETIIASLNVP